MRKLVLPLLLVILPLAGYGQGTSPAPAPTVSVTCNGSNINGVLVDLFSQAKKQFVLQPNLHFALYLSLKDVEFEKALAIVCEQAQLTAEEKDGVYYVRQGIAKPAEPKSVVKIIKPAHTGKLSTQVLTRPVTIRMGKADFRDVVAEIGKVTGVKIEIAPDVPKFKLDAYMLKTSLKFTLDRISEAAHLSYEFTDTKSILIRKA